jgi:hypothetical protein
VEEADGFFSAGRRLVNGIPHSDALGPASRRMLEKEIARELELAAMNRQDLAFAPHYPENAKNPAAKAGFSFVVREKSRSRG